MPQPAHGDPVAAVIFSLIVILIAAKIGGDLATRLGQPAVLGELLFGVVLGNLSFSGFGGFDHIKSDPFVDMLARIGVLILLFEVGLESSVRQMLSVGLSSLIVACLGVFTPFVLGWGVGAWMLPEQSVYLHLFLGATLTATSVGITARVLKDLGRSDSDEGRIILGAAVIDDVLGLVILAAITGIIVAADRGGSLSYGEVVVLVGKATGFLVASLGLGIYLTPALFAAASRLQTRGVLVVAGLIFCFFLAWLADVIGLAPIVGAFAAGLILEDVHSHEFVGRGEPPLPKLIEPISLFLVPIFFVVMGMRTDLHSFVQPGVFSLAVVLILAAIVGKQACSLGVVGRGVDRLSVGLGMIPRGEVGLIFANIGMALSVQGQPVVDSSTYSAVVVMVIVTTMITPPALQWSLRRSAERAKR